jgi:hypothetical protein
LCRCGSRHRCPHEAWPGQVRDARGGRSLAARVGCALKRACQGADVIESEVAPCLRVG